MTLTAPGRAEHYDHKGRLCRCTPAGGVDLATWNASAGKRFNRFIRDLGRLVGSRIRYFRGVEVQRRGALHYHLLLRREDGRPLAITRKALRELAVAHGFGHAVDAQALRAENAGYVAKYVAKSADERIQVPWLGTRRVGYYRIRDDAGNVIGHVQGREEPSYMASFRTWSSSRDWGDTMAEVKAAQQHYVMILERLPSWGEGGARSSTRWALVAPVRPDALAPDDRLLVGAVG